MRKEYIIMPYIGSVLSVNHYLGRRKGGGYYVKQEVVDWKTEFGWLLKRLHLEDWQLPLEVTCLATFRNEQRACDVSNFSKVILDTIEEVTGINDKNMRWRDGNRTIDKNCDPHLLISIQEGKPNLSPDAPELKSTGIKPKSNPAGREI